MKPCPHCGRPDTSREYHSGIDGAIMRDIMDHDCPAWATPPPLDPTPTDTSFIREAWNTPEGLQRYRDWLERQR